MAYGAQYDFQMLNDQGVLVEAIISARGYSGAVTTLIGGASPIVLTYDTQSTKNIGTRPSYVTLNMMSAPGFTLSDIFSQDERYWQVTINYNGSLFWQGYVSQDTSLLEPFMEIGTFEMAITARCGLAALQGFKFLNSSGYFLFGYITITQLLSLVLANTGLTLNIVTAVNIYETRHNTGQNALDQTYVNTQRFFGADGLPMQCADILEAVCQSFGAVCFQRGGQWWFVRLAEMPQPSYYLYNSNAVYISGPTSADFRSNYGPSSSLKMINADQLIGYDLGVSELKYKYLFAYLLNAIQDGSFYVWTTTTKPQFWSSTFPGGAYLGGGQNIGGGAHGSSFYKNSPVNYAYYFQSAGIQCLAGDQLGFSTVFDASFDTSLALNYDIIYVSGGTTQYLQIGTGGALSWSTTRQAGSLISPIINSMIFEPADNSYIFPFASTIICPASVGVISVRIYSLTGASTSTAPASLKTIALYKLDPSASAANNSSAPVPIGMLFDNTLTGASYTYTPPDTQVLLGDSPSPLYAGALCIDGNGTVTKTWARKGVTESLLLIQILANTALDLHKKAYRTFSGATYGIMLYGDCWLIEGLAGSNYYTPLGMTIDFKNMQGALTGVEHDATAGTYTSTVTVLCNKDKNFQS